jgi:hypothetical protein
MLRLCRSTFMRTGTSPDRSLPDNCSHFALPANPFGIPRTTMTDTGAIRSVALSLFERKCKCFQTLTSTFVTGFGR